MANKTEKKPKTAWSTDRERVLVPVYQDEYENLGIVDGMSLTEARTQVRLLAGVPVPLRATTGGSVSGLARALRDAPAEKREQIMAILSAQETTVSEADAKAEAEETEVSEDGE